MAKQWIEDGNANVNFRCDTDRTNIFLIGDSIRLGYCETVAKELEDVAKVFYPKENCKNTQNVITSLRAWMNMFDRSDRVDIVQFNCGHWDMAHWNGYELSLTSEEEYAKNIKMIIHLLKQYFPNARIIFATTTPMNPTGVVGNNPRYDGEIDRYNEIAVRIANAENVHVNDLHGIVRRNAIEFVDYCHLTPASFELLGKEVSSALRDMITNADRT